MHSDYLWRLSRKNVRVSAFLLLFNDEEKTDAAPAPLKSSPTKETDDETKDGTDDPSENFRLRTSQDTPNSSLVVCKDPATRSKYFQLPTSPQSDSSDSSSVSSDSSSSSSSSAESYKPAWFDSQAEKKRKADLNKWIGQYMDDVIDEEQQQDLANGHYLSQTPSPKKRPAKSLKEVMAERRQLESSKED